MPARKRSRKAAKVAQAVTVQPENAPVQRRTENPAPKPAKAKAGPLRASNGHLVCVRADFDKLTPEEVADFRASGGIIVSTYH